MRGIIKVFSFLIDWLFPPQCLLCGKTPDTVPFLCESCYRSCSVYDDRPDSSADHDDHPAACIRVMFAFDEHIQKLVHRLKYQDMPYIGTFLGRRVGEYYRDHEIADCDMLIPVPLNAVRKRERTYNQSAYIARGIASVWGVPVEERLLKRCRNTQTQTRLNKTERRDNMRDAFRVRNKKSIPARVCLIDDVFTTGATTMEAARTLKWSGAETVHILTLATPLKN
ncbi:MAG: ComF family protein [FCB group bacterium]|nr:ComF family protein [FCB group bacterium]